MQSHITAGSDSIVNWEQLMKNFHYENFYISRKKTTIDLSMRKEFPKQIMDSFKVSPIRWTSDYTLLRRTSSEKKIYFVYGTSGLTPDATCTTHPFRFYPVHRENPLGHAKSNSYCVEVDISQAPVDSYFNLQIEEIEWNTDVDKLKGQESFSNFYGADTMAISMIWPANKMAHSVTASTYPANSNDETPVPVIYADSSRIFSWVIPKAIQGNCYRVYWKW